MVGLLALQLQFSFEVSASCCGLMSSPPARPGDDVGRLDPVLSELVGDASDLLDGPVDQLLMVGILGLFGGVVLLARYRTTAIMAKASITSETWRCQPCQDRVSL